MPTEHADAPRFPSGSDKRAGRKKDALPATIALAKIRGLPFALRFEGQKEGWEIVVCFRHGSPGEWEWYRVPFAMYAYALSVGAPAPGWQQTPLHHELRGLLNRWAWETTERRKRKVVRAVENRTGHTTLKELLSKAPLRRILLSQAIAIQSQRKSLGSHGDIYNLRQKLTFAWYGKDPLALAYCELIHAWDKRATRRRCEICTAVFVRPKAIFGTLCPVCRSLNWRQRSKIKRQPIKRRQQLAINIYATLMSTGG